MRILLLMFCVAITFSACQNTTDTKELAPAFSPLVEVRFEQYMKKTNPKLFVVSMDGQHANYIYCPGHADSCLPSRGATKSKILKQCEEWSGGVPCKVYAVGRRIVMQPSPATEEDLSDAAADPEAARVFIRAFEPECLRNSKADADFQRVISQVNLTPEKYCECFGQKFFGSLTRSDFKQLIRDSDRFDEIAEHEPWQSRTEHAAQQCLDDATVAD